LAGALFDATGSDSIIFLSMISMLTLAGGAAIRLKPITPRPV
jgi:hypothetical protein